MLDLIGNTPLVKLGRLARAHGLTCTLVAKLETTNPGGSSKDRPALEMVLAAERDGLLQPGGTIVEPTSGNTGVGLAIVAAQRGYRCHFVTTDKVAPEKIDLLRAYGAEVTVCPVAVPPDHPDSYYSTAERLVREIPGAYRPNQYANPANPLSHEQTTGPEIWRQTAGRITHFVAGAGTCGTITGVARHLKRVNPAVQVIAADPEGSVFSGGSGRPYLIEGVGEDFFPDAWDPSVIDQVVACSDEESYLMARQVAREEGHPARLVRGAGGGRGHQGRPGPPRRRHWSWCSSRTPAAATCPASTTTSGWRPTGSCASATCASVRCSRPAARTCPPLLYVNPEQTVREAVSLDARPPACRSSRCARTIRRSRRPRCPAQSTSWRSWTPPSATRRSSISRSRR